MNYAIINSNGLVVNRIVLEDGTGWKPPEGCIQVEEVEPMDIGGTYIKGAYTPPRVPDVKIPVPQSISDRQFFQQLAVQGVVTQADALSAVKVGSIPSALQALVSQMPADQQFNAQMIISGATVFDRQHPMTIAIGAAYGWSSDQVDQFFVAASKL